MLFWVQMAIAVASGVAILWFGRLVRRAVSGGGPAEKPDVEEVEGLDVYLVCRECGTEFRVTKLGELQIPRHCGEPMQVVRRPRQETVD